MVRHVFESGVWSFGLWLDMFLKVVFGALGYGETCL